MFINKLTDADGEATETQVWIDFAYDCGSLSKEKPVSLAASYEEIGRMLGGMMAHPEKFGLQNADGNKQKEHART